MVLRWIRAGWSGRSLVNEQGPTKPKRRDGVVVVAPFYGNGQLLRCFLDHHRRLGIDEFVFLDLSARANLSARLAAEGDCVVWRPRGGSDPEQAIHWLNYLRRRYASGRWCLSLEPSERFVFRNYESRQIQDFVEFLATERRNQVYALVVEMYGDRPAATLHLKTGQDPLTWLPYFDAHGYTTSNPGRYRDVVVRGGVQRRALFHDRPLRSPPLNRIPLVNWRWYYSYVAGTRLLMPTRLNAPHCPWHSSPTACLLRFALLDHDAARAAAAKAETGYSLTHEGVGSYTGIRALRHRRLKQELSARFTRSADLVECGLLNPGQWF
jgi:hypothetical protein